MNRLNAHFDNSQGDRGAACAECGDHGRVGSWVGIDGVWEFCPARCAAAHDLVERLSRQVAELKANQVAPAADVAVAVDAASGLSPAIAGPAKAVPAVERIVSTEVPGLVIERQGNVLTFRVAGGFIKYDVTGGQLRVLDALDGGLIRPTERAHIVETARSYARRAA